jgi:hypothetical protein
MSGLFGRCSRKCLTSCRTAPRVRCTSRRRVFKHRLAAVVQPRGSQSWAWPQHLGVLGSARLFPRLPCVRRQEQRQQKCQLPSQAKRAASFAACSDWAPGLRLAPVRILDEGLRFCARSRRLCQCRTARTWQSCSRQLLIFFLGVPCTFWELPQRASYDAAPASCKKDIIYQKSRRHLIFGVFLAIELEF